MMIASDMRSELDRIEQQMAADRKEAAVMEARALSFDRLLIKVWEYSGSIQIEQKYFTGFDDPRTGYTLGFTDLFVILVSTSYTAYNQGPYLYQYMDGPHTIHAEVTIDQIMNDIKERVGRINYISFHARALINNGLHELTEILAAINRSNLNVDPRSTQHAYKY